MALQLQAQLRTRSATRIRRVQELEVSRFRGHDIYWQNGEPVGALRIRPGGRILSVR